MSYKSPIMDGINKISAMQPYIYDKENDRFIYISKIVNAQALEAIMNHDEFKKLKNKFTEVKEFYIKNV